MKRVQLYLNSRSVSLLDEFAKLIPWGRSKIIRAAIDQLAENLGKLMTMKNLPSDKKFILDGLIGAIHKKGTQTDFASRDDRRYLSD